MKNTKVNAYLILRGDYFDVEYVSKTLGITPSYTQIKGEILKNGKESRHTEWCIETDYEISLNIEKQFNKLLSNFSDKVILLSQLCDICKAEWSLVFIIEIENGETPAMCLSKENIRFLATIDADIDIDIYVLST